MVNNSYVFVWIDDEDGVESITAAVIMKDRIKDYLESLGWTRDNLIRKMNYIREGKSTYMGDIHKDGCKFIFSKKFVEQPINIQLPRTIYMQLADKVWKKDFDI